MSYKRFAADLAATSEITKSLIPTAVIVVLGAIAASWLMSNLST